jgi:uncharacterized protein (DUF1330 family)
MSYPKWLYSKEHGAKLIESAEQEKQLEGTWKDTPAAFDEAPKAEKAPEKPSKSSKTKEAAE